MTPDDWNTLIFCGIALAMLWVFCGLPLPPGVRELLGSPEDADTDDPRMQKPRP